MITLTPEQKRELLSDPTRLLNYFADITRQARSDRLRLAFERATAALGKLVELEQQYGVERGLEIARKDRNTDRRADPREESDK